MSQPPITKISQPGTTGLFLRNRLFQMLDRLREKQVVWIAAPAGAGKSSLVSGWLESRELSSLWYHVDQRDADLATFFYYLGLAAQKSDLKKSKPLPVLTPEYLPGLPAFTRSFFEELFQRLKQSGVMVLDNYQDFDQPADFHNLIANGLELTPQGITVIVLSKSGPPPAFARLQANNRVGFIGWDDIRFTQEETAQLASILMPDSVDAVQLHEKTGGWAAGIVLLAETWKVHQENALPPVANQTVFAYFAGEIFSRTDYETRDFLLKTAFLPHMSAAMAEAVNGTRQAGQILSALCRNHYFTQKHSGEMFSYHPLFRDFLLTTAEEHFSPMEYAATLQNAAVVLENTGQPEDAARLFIQGNNFELLAALAAAHAPKLVMRGSIKTLEEWLAVIPDELLEKMPWLLYWKGVCRLFADPAESMACFSRAYRLFDVGQDKAGAFLSAAGQVDAVIFDLSHLHTIDPWIEILKEFTAEETAFPSPEIATQVITNLFIALALRQPSNPALPELIDRACFLSEKCADITLRLKTVQYAVYCNILRGEIDRAGMYLKTLKEVAQLPETGRTAAIFSAVIESFYCYHAGMYDLCLELVQKLLKDGEESGIRVFDNLAAGFAAAASLGKGDLPSADSFLKKMSSVLRSKRRNDMTYYHFLYSWRCLLTGAHAEALTHAEQSLKLARESGSVIAVSVSCHLLSHALYELNRLQDAYNALSEAEHVSIDIHNPRITCLCRLSRAWFSFREGRAEQGVDDLKQALAIGRQRQYTSFEVWIPSMMSTLCTYALEHEIEADYVCTLIEQRSVPPDLSSMGSGRWPWPVEIRALGGFALYLNGSRKAVVGKAQQKTLALLKALVTAGADGISVNRLSALLWPDADGDKAHHALEMVIHRTRKLLGREDALLLRQGLLRLNSLLCRVDAFAFSSGMDSALAAFAEQKTGTALSLFEKYLPICKGYLLDDCDDEELPWILPARKRLVLKYRTGIEKSGGLYESENLHDKALELYRRAFDQADESETLCRCYIRCCLRLGRRSEAVEAYRRLERTMMDTLSVAPSFETANLLKSLS